MCLAEHGGWYRSPSTGLHIAGAASEPVTADDAQVYIALSPVRVLDTRDVGGTQFGPKEIRTLSFASYVPPAATAVIVNTTVDRATGQTFLTVWPTGEPMPQHPSTTQSGAS